MIILGIDPGSRFLGYGVISVENANHLQLKVIDYGVLKFNAETPLSERLHDIGVGVHELFRKFQPIHLSLEKIFLGKNADSAFKMGHARGVIIYEALRAQCKVHEYATRVVKKGIVGNGAAEKEHVRTVISNLLQIPTLKSLDASDALAMACYHASQLNVIRLKEKINRQQNQQPQLTAKRPVEKGVL